MQLLTKLGVLSLLLNSTIAVAAEEIENPQIDMQGYLRVAAEAAQHREDRRLTEAEFIRLSREDDTIVLDARSKRLYDLLHVRGAVNLSFPDISLKSVEELIPDKDTRILIYCNNNFRNAERPFPEKRATASLNLSTYIALYDYGYRKIFELGPVLELDSTRLELESTADTAAKQSDAVSHSAAKGG